MIKPEKPPNENERLKALYSLNILDTDAEERFDRITRIAKALFNVPIVLVSLIDGDRQWLKSKQGLYTSETPRDISFCGHAILHDELMIVKDTSQDLRFCDNPLVLQQPNIKFYLGCPIKVKGKHNVGTLCLIDQVSRDFTPAEQQIIKDLAGMVQTELESLHISTTDELTSLFNRRGFVLIASHVINLSQRAKNDLILLFFDLDKFKYVNDTFGHEEGDRVLKIFSHHLLDNFRNSDVVARLGGDEFCVLCSGFTPEDIQLLLDRLDESLAVEKLDGYKIEYSVGHIRYEPEKHYNVHDLLEEADGQRYLNKRKKDGL